MNILKEYTLDYVKRNKKSSVAIMIAMLIATILMSTLVLGFYNIWYDGVNFALKGSGNWHGELYDATLGKDLEYVKAYASVEEVMVKGEYYVAEVGDTKRPYLFIRDADAAYWNAMPDQYDIIEGRMPNQTGEIAISKQFVAAHPEYHVGDTITLPVGERMNNGSSLDSLHTFIEGEIFNTQSEVTYTIVAVLDVTAPSMYPGYFAIGYLEHDTILPEDDLVVYIRFKDMRDTYKELPKIAAAIGYEKDEYGNYLLKYNSDLLSKYFIFPKMDVKVSADSLWIRLSTFIVYIGSTLVAVGVFVFIIHNAFEISMNGRKKQLGMFKSIGATPKQIRASILFEAIILSIIPIIVGLMISKVTWYYFIEKVNEVYILHDSEVMIYKTNWWIDGIIIALVLLIGVLSAYIPSRKINKKMPIEVLREESINKKASGSKRLFFNFKKRSKQFRKSDLKAHQNIYRELATNQFRANKKSFRTSVISMALSFLLFMVCLTGMASGDLVNDIYYYQEKSYDVALSLMDGKPIDPIVYQALSENPNIEEFIGINKAQGTIWITAEQESEAFKAIGGLDGVISANKSSCVKRDNQYRIRTSMIAIDDENFKGYCQQIGVDWQPFFEDTSLKTIVYNQVEDSIHSTMRNIVYIPFLSLEEGDKLTISEKVWDDDPGSSETEIVVGAVTELSPEIQISVSNYSLIQIMPLSTYQKLVANWDMDKAAGAMQTKVEIKVAEQNITAVSSQLEEVCENIYGSGDYHIWDTIKEAEEDEASDQIALFEVGFISGLLALIGISNAFCTVYASLEQRNRSFAILRSVGIPPKGVDKLLMYEAMTFAIKPILYASVVEILWMAFLIKIDQSSWGEFIGYVPIHIFGLFAIAIILTILIAYWIGSHKIRKQNIVEAIKCESI